MKQITLRFPVAGYGRLLSRCEQYGVSIRAFFEAAGLIALEDEAAPDRHDQQVAMWGVAARLEASEVFRSGPRHRLVISLDDEVHASISDAANRFGVSMNAAFALLVVTPWPEDDRWPVSLEYRQDNLRRVVERARRLDFLRGRPDRPERSSTSVV